MKREHNILIILAGIILLASFFRLNNITLSPPGLYPDEAMNGNNALEAISTRDYKVFYPENNGREGMFINIQAFFLKIFLDFYPSPEPWMLRFTSALFGIFTVLGIYFLTKELFRTNAHAKIIALISTFFLATSFWHINFSRIGFRAIMAPFFLTWGVYLLLLSFRKVEENSQLLISNFQNLKFPPERLKSFSRAGKILFPIFAGMVYGFGMHSYIAYRATPLFILFIFFLFSFTYGWKKIVKLGSLFVLGSIIVSIPLITYFAENPQDFLGRTSQVSVFSGSAPLKDLGLNVIKTIGMFFVYGDSNWRHNLSGMPELFWPVAIFFAIGIIIGITSLFRNSDLRISNFESSQNDRIQKFKNSSFIRNSVFKIQNFSDVSALLILFAWLVITALPVIISNEGIPHALRSILMIPPAIILAGFGSVWIYNWIKERNVPKKFLFTFGTLLLLLVALHAYYTYFILWAPNRETANAFSSSSMDVGNVLNSLPKEIPKYVVVNARGTLVRGIPMPSQTVMYLTDSFTPEKQKEKNIFYITPEKKNDIPSGSFVVELN